MLKLYNTLTKEKEEIKPTNNIVKMYTCGPTVYSYAHIGNYRAYIIVDLIRRAIKSMGMKLEGVMNLTDVGHLTSDEDEGEDKMVVASLREKKSPYEIANYYTEYFFKNAKRLNLDLPEKIIKATSVIDDIIKFVEVLIKNGYAYETDNGVYFDVEKDESYGILSGLKLKQRLAGARIAVDEKKHNPADFALWVKAPKEHLMQWDSPWGSGYPGWHIECSTIGTKFLGDHIDIHTGGIDHIPVHHENEIAQNFAYYGKKVVDLWLHVSFMNINGGKMGKSLGNVYTLEELEQNGFAPLDFKYFIMNAHYKKPQNFSFEAMESAKISLNRLYKFIEKHSNGTKTIDANKILDYKTAILNEIYDDLNYPNALAIIWDLLKNNEPSKDIYELMIDIDALFGLDMQNYAIYTARVIAIPKNIKDLAEKRWQAKIKKDWKEADKLRQEVLNLGFIINDKSDGYDIELN